MIPASTSLPAAWGVLAQTTGPSEPGLRNLLERWQLGRTFEETTWLHWTLLLTGIFLGVVVGKLVHTLLRRLGDQMMDKRWRVRATVFHSLAGPVHLWLITIGLTAGLSAIVVYGPVQWFIAGVLKLLFSISIGWLLYNLVDLIALALTRMTRRTKSPLDDQVVPLVRKSLRLFLIVVMVLFVAENVFGADITAWLAGLGIAGLAVSLAAQDSIKNLFGSLTIFLDRTFTVGQAIKVGNYSGEVIDIGFRSTKLRTADGAVVTVPNSMIVDSQVENISRRPYIRRVMDIAIACDTPPDKLQQAVQIVTDILAGPDIARAWNAEKFPPRVFFDELRADGLNIKVTYWHHPPNFWDYQAHAQRINLAIMERFAEAGICFAVPIRAVHLAGDDRHPLAVRLQDDSPADNPPGNPAPLTQ
jgi:MscS family membrane protein